MDNLCFHLDQEILPAYKERIKAIMLHHVVPCGTVSSIFIFH